MSFLQDASIQRPFGQIAQQNCTVLREKYNKRVAIDCNPLCNSLMIDLKLYALPYSNLTVDMKENVRSV
jgi:hypothetical protein